MFSRIHKLLAILIIVVAIFLAFFVYPNGFDKFIGNINKGFAGFPTVPFRLGLDLKGGVELLYQADLKDVKAEDTTRAMDGLRTVIENRINVFGVREAEIKLIGDNRLSVEIPGIKDPNQAVKEIGKTPYLVFMEPKANYDAILEKNTKAMESKDLTGIENPFQPTDLTGRYLERASIEFNSQTSEPMISLKFNTEGAKLFEDITGRNIGKPVGIFIDDTMISAPRVQEKISGGSAQITGKFTNKEAKDLANNLNAGALPAPITLISQKSVGATLGLASINSSLKAGAIGFLAVAIFMILFYRFPELIASLALTTYGIIMLSLFKLVPVTMTLAGIGGFILSIGMAVDVHVLIFSRTREELKEGKDTLTAVENGFSRAWPAVRDGHLTALIVALILFIFGTSFVKGFATTLLIGVALSLFTGMVVTRIFMLALVGTRLNKFKGIWK
jgi:preprotein translocase subunit SecD